MIVGLAGCNVDDQLGKLVWIARAFGRFFCHFNSMRLARQFF
jgi:hypothetical protein